MIQALALSTPNTIESQIVPEDPGHPGRDLGGEAGGGRVQSPSQALFLSQGWFCLALSLFFFFFWLSLKQHKY